jgi:hypothetical protein
MIKHSSHNTYKRFPLHTLSNLIFPKKHPQSPAIIQSLTTPKLNSILPKLPVSPIPPPKNIEKPSSQPFKLQIMPQRLTEPQMMPSNSGPKLQTKSNPKKPIH